MVNNETGEVVEVVDTTTNRVIDGFDPVVYYCQKIDFPIKRKTFQLVKDIHKNPRVDCVGDDDGATQKQINAEAKLADINALIARFLNGDPDITAALAKGIDWTGGNVDISDVPAIELFNVINTNQKALADNPLMNEFIDSLPGKSEDRLSILTDPDVFGKRWNEFISKKNDVLKAQEAAKEKETDNNA